MADPDARARHTSVWDALAHPARRRIVEILRGAPTPTGLIHETLEDEGLSTSRFATLRHLQQMREADLVLATRSGRERINALNGSALYEATIGWLAPPDRSLATSLHRLRLSAEENAMSEVRHLSVQQSILISAPREQIWSLLTRDTRSWWRPPFALLGDADEVELVIPERAGGSVIERSGPGPERTAAWGMLVRREERALLEWTSVVCGAPGASGTVRITLEPAEEAAARLTVTQDAVGVLPDGIDADIELGWSNKLTTISGLLAGADGHDAS